MLLTSHHAAKNGVVVATEKKQKTVLYDENSISKVHVPCTQWNSVNLTTSDAV